MNLVKRVDNEKFVDLHHRNHFIACAASTFKQFVVTYFFSLCEFRCVLLSRIDNFGKYINLKKNRCPSPTSVFSLSRCCFETNGINVSMWSVAKE